MFNDQNQNERLNKMLNSAHMENAFQREKQNKFQSSQYQQFQSSSKQFKQLKEFNKQSTSPVKNFTDLDEEYQKMKVQLNKNKNKTFYKSKWDTYAPYSFLKLSNDQKDNIFQKLFQDYLTLKKQHNEYVEKYTVLNGKFHRLGMQIAKVKKHSGLSTSQKIRVEKDSNEEVSNLKLEIKRLHQKIFALTGNQKSKPMTAQKRPQSGYKTQKTIFPVTQNIKQELQLQRKHVKQLLLIIDQLKKNKLESPFTNKQFDIQETGQRAQKVYKAQKNQGNQNQFKQYANQIFLLKEKYSDLQLCYNKMNEDKDRVIKQLNQDLIQIRQNQRMKKNSNKVTKSSYQVGGNQQRIKELVDQKQRLQRQLLQQSKMPFYQDNKNVIQTQQKLSKLQGEYTRLKQQLANTKQTNTKYLSQLQFKSKQSSAFKSQNQKLKKQLKEWINKANQGGQRDKIANQYDQNDYYRKLMNLVKLDGQDPVWKKYNDMARPSFSVLTIDQLRHLAQQLWNGKLQLLAHLEKAQIQLKTNKQNADSRLNSFMNDKQYLQEQLRVTKCRLDQWISMEKMSKQRQFNIYQDKGVKYSDTVSVFQADQEEIKALEANQNYFDLFLGQMTLDQGALLKNPQNKVKNVGHIISFLTIDFYNHETQHSNFAQGVVKKLLNNFSFKVQVNPYFIKYLGKNTINVELWSPQGTSNILLGKGQIWLRDMLNNSAKDVSTVIRGKCPIYHNQKQLVGTVQYRFRMRLPISPFLQWTHTKKQMDKGRQVDYFGIPQRKKLSITIQRASGLSQFANAFVYFTIQNEDFFTQPQRGPSPFWDFHREIDVIVDDQFKDYLKENYVQFTIFDDQKQVNEDVIGLAKANLTNLLQKSQQLQLDLDVQNNVFQTIGKLKIKVFWV